MNAKGVKDGIETVLNIADDIDRGRSSPLLIGHITVPYKPEGALVVPMAHDHPVGGVLEVADEIEKTSRLGDGLEVIEYMVESSSRLKGFMVAEHSSRSLERPLNPFFTSTLFYFVLLAL